MIRSILLGEGPMVIRLLMAGAERDTSLPAILEDYSAERRLGGGPGMGFESDPMHDKARNSMASLTQQTAKTQLRSRAIGTGKVERRSRRHSSVIASFRLSSLFHLAARGRNTVLVCGSREHGVDFGFRLGVLC